MVQLSSSGCFSDSRRSKLGKYANRRGKKGGVGIQKKGLFQLRAGRRSWTVFQAGWSDCIYILSFFVRPRETRMSDLGLQPREVWKQPDGLPAEERRGSSEITSKPRRCPLGCQLGPLCICATLIWHSEPIILILILILFVSITHVYFLILYSWVNSAVSELSPDILPRWGRCLFCCTRPFATAKSTP
jgi:hypothetical protein